MEKQKKTELIANKRKEVENTPFVIIEAKKEIEENGTIEAKYECYVCCGGDAIAGPYGSMQEAEKAIKNRDWNIIGGLIMVLNKKWKETCQQKNL